MKKWRPSLRTSTTMSKRKRGKFSNSSRKIVPKKNLTTWVGKWRNVRELSIDSWQREALGYVFKRVSFPDQNDGARFSRRVEVAHSELPSNSLTIRQFSKTLRSRLAFERSC